jgi:hypothetical protein
LQTFGVAENSHSGKGEMGRAHNAALRMREPAGRAGSARIYPALVQFAMAQNNHGATRKKIAATLLTY